MKNIIFILHLVGFALPLLGQVAVNNDGSNPAASAMLEVKSTTKGMLVPRMTTAQRTAIASPATGLLVFDNTTGSFWFRSTTAWVELADNGSNPSSKIADADGNTQVQTEANANENIIRFDLNGAEKMVLQQNAGGQQRLELPNVNNNTAIGSQALSSNTTGSINTATGQGALQNNTGGNFNTATGVSALTLNTIGSYNAAHGYFALSSNSTGNYNTASGDHCLSSNTSASANTAVGNYALYSNSTGSENTALGASAMVSNSVGYSNTAIGTKAMCLNTNRSNLVAVGDSTLFNNGTGATANYEGSGNTALGSKALFANTTGYANAATGTNALFANTTGTANTASGNSALIANTTGNFNTASGAAALFTNTTGSSNTAIGESALFTNTTGSSNTAFGQSALFSNTTGSGNSAIGQSALYSNTTGSGNTALGNGAGTSLPNNVNNVTCIGSGAGFYTTGTNHINIGGTSVTAIAGQVPWGTYSDARIKRDIQPNVPGLDFIQKLRPVTYLLDIDEQWKIANPGIPDTVKAWPEKYDIEKIRMTGFLAQEVEAAAKECRFDFSGVHAPINGNGLYSLGYAEFTVPLVKAVQEQQGQIEELKRENSEHITAIADQKAENAALRAQIQVLEDKQAKEMAELRSALDKLRLEK